MMARKSREQIIKELEERIEELEIRLKHLQNDLALTKKEYEQSLEDYLEIYANLEKLVEERTRELQELHETLEQKGRELQIMLDSSPAMMFFKDVNLRYIRVNKTFAETLGFPITEIIGKTHEELFPERPPFGKAEDLKVLTTGKPVLKKEELLETKTETRQLQIDRFPIHDTSGQVIGIIGFALDITELKRAEAEKKELEAQLIQAQKMESIGMLAGGVAHDFNNVLGVILGYAQLAQMDLEEGHPIRPYINEIVKAAQRASGVVRTLLDYARPQAFEFEVTNVNEHVRFVVKQLRKSIDFDHQRMTIEIKEDSSPSFASLDAGKFEQALLNLGKNALQALPRDRPGKVIFSLENLYLSEAFCRTRLGMKPGKYVRVSVIDNGIGIPEKNLNKIFEPFFTTKETGQGTGLGLSQVYSIIREHKGHIHVYSEEGAGTRFNIYLKYEEPVETEEKEEEEPEPSELMGNGETILVVEDNEQMRNVLVTSLQGFGFKAIPATNGKEGVEKYQEYKPEIVILDIKMPVMDGKEAFTKIRELDPSAKIIFSSGFGMTMEEIQKLGANGSITKPYDPIQMIKTIHDLLNQDKTNDKSVVPNKSDN